MGNGVQELDSRMVMPVVTEERMAWLGLVLTPGLGPLRILRLIHKAGSAQRVLDMPPMKNWSGWYRRVRDF